MVVSLEVAVVDPGLLHINGEIWDPIADVLNPAISPSEITASDRILICFFLRETIPMPRLGKTKTAPMGSGPVPFDTRTCTW